MRAPRPGVEPAGAGPSHAWIRRRIVVVEGFQKRFVLTQLTWLAVLFTLLSAAVFISPVAGLLGSEGDDQLRMADRFLALHQSIWPLVISFFICASLVTILLTHRVAGPLYRFRRVFADIGRGNLAIRVRLRETDYLKTEARAIEAMVTSLRDRVSRLKAAHQDLRGEADLLLEGPDPIPPDRLAHLLAALERAEEELDTFNTAPPQGTTDAPTRHTADVGVPPPMPNRTQIGFTIVELMIAVCMLSVLLSFAVPAYARALNLARMTRAIGDLRTVDRLARIHVLQNGCLPSTLADIGLDTMRDPWGRPYVYYPIASGPSGSSTCTACQGGCVTQSAARKDKNLHPVNSDFDVFSKGADGLTTSALSAKTSADDIIRGNNGGFFGLGSDY